MKKQLEITATLFATIYFLLACNNADNNSANNNSDTLQTETTVTPDASSQQMNSGFMSVMNGMMDKMKGMQMTGDFDYDFAKMMIEHHHAAVDMAQIEISKGTDEKIKAMAQNIITKQTEEIKKLQDIVNSYKTSEMKNDSSQKHDELHEAMENMMSKMNGMQMTGNTDKDFVMMMIPHHESAVSMFKEELKHGRNAQLKQMAQKGIADQTKEINGMKSWMDANK